MNIKSNAKVHQLSLCHWCLRQCPHFDLWLANLSTEAVLHNIQYSMYQFVFYSNNKMMKVEQGKGKWSE